MTASYNSSMAAPQFHPTEFDDWSTSYDQDVQDQGFPFEGYTQVLQTILNLAPTSPGDPVLDLGTGTGNLAAQFAVRGAQIWGLDFSTQMLAQARLKLPAAVLAQADIRAGWPPAFQRRYRAVVSAYTFHHFTLNEKVALVRRLLDHHLLPGGRVVIGDIAFPDAAAQDEVRRTSGPGWDEEHYWLADEALAAFHTAGVEATFHPVSLCAGVFEFQANPRRENEQFQPAF